MTRVPSDILGTAVVNLEELTIDKTTLSISQWGQLLGRVATSPGSRLRRLHLADISLLDVDRHDLAGAVANIREVTLDNVQVSREQWTAVLERISQDERNVLETLELGLSYKYLGSELPGPVLAEAVSNLRRVRLSGNNLEKVLLTKILRRVVATQRIFEDKVDMWSAAFTQVDVDVIVDAVGKLKEFAMDFAFVDNPEVNSY